MTDLHHKLVAGAGVVVFLLGLFYLTSLNYLELNEVGITWSLGSGRVDIQEHSGWHMTPPWVLVSVINTEPARVCITSAAHAAFNCKLVEFVPSAYREFVRIEGFRYYWWANRLSFNWGYHEEYRGMRDILRGYAFSARQYPFVKVIRDYEGS